jgi:spore coat polysaccharide biosynthesis predicted glycosyltransferase SpsG
MLYEATTTGLPSLVVSFNKAQEREASEFALKGGIKYLGSAKHLDQSKLHKELKAALNRNVRQKMANISQSMIDGRGSNRIANQILKLVGQKFKVH